MFVQINGVQHSLWRAVDQDGTVLDILMQPRRDKRAAVKFLRKLLKGLAYVPRAVITDTLASDGAALRAVLPRVAHRCHTGLHNSAENARRRASGSGGCGAARTRGTPSGASPPTGPSPPTSARAAIA